MSHSRQLGRSPRGVVNRTDLRLTQGPDALCMYGSGQMQTEDYVAQKLLKGSQNNFDSNSRLCMSSVVAGYVQSFVPMVPPAAMKI